MRQHPFELQPGQVIDRYELLLPVASGGTSQIWAARLRGTRGFEKLVALKTLGVPDSGARELERMLWHEARLASRIQHPNVAQCFDLIEHESSLCLTMEWIDGESLSSLLRQAGAGGLPMGVALQIIVQALKGLHAAHELCDAKGQSLGLVHCDVSPQNLMITSSGTVKWVDFGIAKVRHAKSERGRVMGKPSFMAPEQAAGLPLDRRADVFSLGVVLYLLTTGRHPFRAESSLDTLRAICSGAAVTPPTALVDKYPSSLERSVLRALAHDPAARFQSAAEMLDELSFAFPGYASEGELAELLRRTCGASLAQRRTRVNDALERSSARVPSTSEPALFPAVISNLEAPLAESTPGSLAPAMLQLEPTPIAPIARLRPLPIALVATAAAFIGAFSWTFASAPAQPHPTPVSVAATADPPLPNPNPNPNPNRNDAALPVTAVPTPSSSALPTPTPAKKRKAASVGERYGI